MYRLNIETKTLEKLEPTTFSSNNLRERYDIQEWIYDQPEVLDEELLIVGKEVLPGEVAGRRTQIRLDLLALDRQGNLVIIELKRDDSGADAYWQAIKYAAHCSTFGIEQISAILALDENITTSEARNKILEFAEIESDSDINRSQRIILIAREFHSDAIASAMWLKDRSIDIKCVKLSPFRTPENSIFVSSTTIFPTPEAEDYIEKKAAKLAKQDPQAINSPYANDTPQLSESDLEIKLLESLRRTSELTPRLVEFFKILASTPGGCDREQIKQILYDRQIGNNIGHSGRLLSNISQFITKKSNGHLRQLVSFSSEGRAGATKANYQINPQYSVLVAQTLEKLSDNLDSEATQPIGL